MQDFRLPDAINVAVHVPTGLIRLQFIYEGEETVSVLLDQTRLLGLLPELQTRTENKAVTPISRDLVREGQVIEVVGMGWKPLPRGALRLLLHAEVDGRQVTIPLALSPDDVADLRKVIST